MPMWRSQWPPSGKWVRSRAKASRGHGKGARLKYSASPLAACTSFTALGSNSVSASVTGAASVAISAPLSRSRSATARMPSAGAKGSSPCRFTTMVSSLQPAMRAHSARRSVPDGCAVDVIATRTPLPFKASAMRWSSAATQTSRAPAASARRATCRTSGSPASRRKGLPGRRVAAWRAGMATTKSDAGFIWVIRPCRGRSARRCDGQTLPFRRPHLVEQRDPERLGQLGAHRYAEIVVAGQVRAFHRVLLGHQHRQAAAEFKIRRAVTVVVGECVRDHCDAEAAQHGEETLRVADARHRVHALACKRRQRTRTTTGQWHGLLGQQPHRPFAESGADLAVDLPGVAAQVHNAEVAPFRPLHRFAQRARGQPLCIAIAEAAIDDLDLDIARQAVMLQAVVADHDVTSGFRQRRGCGHAIAIDAELRTGVMRDERGLVADLGGAAFTIDPARLRRLLAAVTAAGHARLEAFRLQALYEGDGQRCLAGSANADVAHDDHRHVAATTAQEALLVEPPAHAGDAGIHGRQHARAPRDARFAIPVAGALAVAHAIRSRGTACDAGARTGRPAPATRRAYRVRRYGPGPSPVPGRRVRWSTGGARSPAWCGWASGG